MNTFDVTGSKWLSIAVLLIDLAKGVAAVALAGVIVGNAPGISGAAGIGAVLGHNYPVWLGFHGGRGLATAAGVFILIGWVFVPLWCLLFVLAYLPSRDIHTGNIAATLVSPAVVLLAPESVLAWSVAPGSLPGFRVVALIICALIMIRHRDVIPSVLKSFHKPTS